MSQVQIECPICMEIIEDQFDKTITKCGHTFHSTCIFENISTTWKLECPCCRGELVDTKKEKSHVDSYDVSLEPPEIDNSWDFLFEGPEWKGDY